MVVLPFWLKDIVHEGLSCCVKTEKWGEGGEWVGGEPRKTAGPTLRGAARSRTLQEGPNVCCGLAVNPGKPRPPTHPARWQTLVVLRFGTLRRYHAVEHSGCVRSAGWHASAIPPKVVPDRCKGIHCLAFVFSALGVLR